MKNATVCLLFKLLAGLLCSAFADDDPASSMVTNVSMVRAIQDAEVVAAQNRNWRVMVGDGHSMAPYFHEGSVLLVDRARFDDLKPGMMVVFRDDEGDLVGHWLVSRIRGHWVTRGVNNKRHDPGFMSRPDYEGVVFGVLHSSGQDAEGLAYAQQLSLPIVLGKSR